MRSEVRSDLRPEKSPDLKLPSRVAAVLALCGSFTQDHIMSSSQSAADGQGLKTKYFQ